jgi:antirestriction protein
MSRAEQEPDARHEREHAPTTAPRIWAGSLADYNEGRLHGQWIDADQTPEELELAIHAMLASAPTPGAEEWGIFDHDGFHGLQITEHEDLAVVAKLGHGIAAHGPAYAYWADIVDCDIERLDEFTNAFVGVFDSRAAYAEHLLETLGIPDGLEALPDWIKPYVSVDILGMSHDLDVSGEVRFAGREGKVWVFDGKP